MRRAATTLALLGLLLLLHFAAHRLLASAGVLDAILSPGGGGALELLAAVTFLALRFVLYLIAPGAALAAAVRFARRRGRMTPGS